MSTPNLPAGYSLDDRDPDLVYLIDPDGEKVAAFSRYGASPDTIERIAWEMADQKSSVEDRFVESIVGPERPPLAERIEAAFDAAVEAKKLMDYARDAMRESEDEQKLAHADEWAAAKNSEVRAVLLAGWLSADTEYQVARGDYRDARADYRLAWLEIERLKLLVALEGRA